MRRMWVWCPSCFSVWSTGDKWGDAETRYGRRVGDHDADEGYPCCIFGCMGKMHPQRRMPVTKLRECHIDPVWAAFKLGGQQAVRDMLRETMTAQDLVDACYAPLPRLR